MLLECEQGSSCIIVWNHREFQVVYGCHSSEIKIDDYYLIQLLEKDENEYAERFYLMVMTAFINYPEAILGIQSTKYIQSMLERCTDKLERDRLLHFMNELVLHHRHVKEIMNANGMNILVHLLTLANSHTTHTNAIEAEEVSEKLRLFETRNQDHTNMNS